jgi:hypothetical protein
MVMVNAISVITTEYMVTYGEVCYLVNTLGILFSVLYRPFFINVSEACVSILHIRALAQGTSYSNVNASLLPQSTLLAEATVTNRLDIPLLNQPSGSQYFHNLVLYHL